MPYDQPPTTATAASREALTDKIVLTKLAKGLKWQDVAKEMGMSPVFATAALMGQMTLLPEQAEVAARLFDLSPLEAKLLQAVPSRGSLGMTVPTDPLIYRFYEITQVYGTTLKEVIQDEFGDGIMSAIDFSMDVERVPDPRGDRVKVTMSGKFLPYKRF
jgi:cyanate lyase